MRIEKIGDATLYLGDCQEIISSLPHFDAIITDPPYGISHRRGKSSDRKGTINSADCREWDKCAPDLSIFPDVPRIIWGGNYLSDQLPGGRWLLWDKQCGGGSGDFSEFEIAWSSFGTAIKCFRHMWLGVQRDSENAQPRLHPTQKPIALMEWCIDKLPSGCLKILDPFMGSGTTGVACMKMGRSFIGIEREEKYFDIACKRIEEATRQSDMFVSCSSPPMPSNRDLFEGSIR